jgi:membrane fusion protein, multidrug efflux system
MILPALAAAALGLSMVWGCGGSTPEAAAPVQAERTVAVAAVEMVPRDLSQTLQVTGSIEPIRELRIAARMSGILNEVRFEEGRRVGAGTVLARFDVSEQQAELSRARTLLQQAEAHYRRAQEMRDRALISVAEYENTRAERAVAESEVRLWETRVALGTIRSPAAGVITQKFVETGTAVTSGEPLFVVADVSTLVIRVGISDVHAAHLSPRQTARITVDAMPGRTWEGSIRRIFPSADPDSRLVPVEFALTAAGGRELPAPGYLARVEVEAEQRPDVLAVPNEALLASAGEAPFVFVIDDDRLVRRNVVPGVSRRDWTEMVEGVAPGELVVGSNPANLREGMLVRVTNRISHPSGGS